MEPDRSWFLRGAEEGLDGLSSVRPQLVPVVGLSENALGQALGDEAAVGFLGYFKYKLAHDDEE